MSQEKQRKGGRGKGIERGRGGEGQGQQARGKGQGPSLPALHKCQLFGRKDVLSPDNNRTESSQQ